MGPPPWRRIERKPALREPEFWLPLPGKESSHAHRSHVVYGLFQAPLAELKSLPGSPSPLACDSPFPFSVSVPASGNLDKQTGKGSTALHYCCLTDSAECLKLLLRGKASIGIGEPPPTAPCSSWRGALGRAGESVPPCKAAVAVCSSAVSLCCLVGLPPSAGIF